MNQNGKTKVIFGTNKLFSLYQYILTNGVATDLCAGLRSCRHKHAKYVRRKETLLLSSKLRFVCVAETLTKWKPSSTKITYKLKNTPPYFTSQWITSLGVFFYFPPPQKPLNFKPRINTPVDWGVYSLKWLNPCPPLLSSVFGRRGLSHLLVLLKVSDICADLPLAKSI